MFDKKIHIGKKVGKIALFFLNSELGLGSLYNSNTYSK